MKKNSLLIPLNIHSNKENFTQNSYTQYTSNISSKRNNFYLLDSKRQISLKSLQNKMPEDKTKSNAKTIKYEKYDTLNRNNNYKIKNVIQRLNNDNNKQRVIKSNLANKMNYIFVNGKQNIDKNINNIQNQITRNNHSFYESKYNKKNGNLVLNNLSSKNENKKINSVLVNDANKENINLSNIKQNKNLNKKHIILNIDKISNNTNELTCQITFKKPLTPLTSISQQRRNSIMNTNYQTIQINNKNNKTILNSAQNTVNELIKVKVLI